jgi:membrane protein insertase Oxa1/YidC/SpoIIIJ
MYILEVVLTPVVWLMELVLGFYVFLFSSIGISILFTSFTFTLLLLPVQKIANRVEKRIGEKIKKIDDEVKVLGSELKGEKLFLATEIIYERNGYHPIQSVGMGASFFAMLPVLISAILLFTSSEVLIDISFLFIDDLSKPDGLLGIVNVLPLLMLLITLLDAKLRFKDDKKRQYRFFFISLVFLVIVYRLPSGLVLYWTGSNIMSLILNRLQSDH